MLNNLHKLMSIIISLLTFRKNSPPAGKTILWLPGSTFNFSPSLNQSILGLGDPSALQFNVAGSCLGTITSIGCSVIRGYSNPETKENKIFVIVIRLKLISSMTNENGIEGMEWIVWYLVKQYKKKTLWLSHPTQKI